MYKRAILSQISAQLFKGKAVIIVGPRQVGKTTLAGEIIEGASMKWIKFNCDNPTDREKLNNKDLEQLKILIGENRIIFIDEAQRVETIGQTIKLLVDEYGDKKQIIATGSSSINLLEKTSEPLTGRKRVFRLFPLSVKEIFSDSGLLDLEKKLEELLVFGSYPEIINTSGAEEKIEALVEITSSYLFKDIFEFQEIRNAAILDSLLRALALQIGSEVSYNELANILGIEKKTVERYVDLLEKNFIIFRLPPYAINKRRTISKLHKIYFYDVGVRNAIIGNFNALASRTDAGALWENFVLVERIKFSEYEKIRAGRYFLRTYDGAEIDLVEEKSGKIRGYEFKLGKNRTGKKGSVMGVKYETITPENISGFIL